MKALILTEGGRDIGFGHIMRCLAFYEGLSRARIRTKLVISTDHGVKEILKNKRYKIANWLDTIDVITKEIYRANIIIIDSYLADINFYNKISGFGKNMVYIDDFNRLNYPKGIIINGSVYAQKIKYRKSSGKKYLLGPKFAFLRKEFWNVSPRLTKKDIDSILVTFGGIDLQRNMTYKILAFLQKKYPLLKKNIVFVKGLESIEKIKKTGDKTTKFICQPGAKDMLKIMLASDIAISAGGQTLYELARCGIPTIGICLAENQEMNLKEWSEGGFLKYIGWHNSKSLFYNLEKSIETLKEKRTRLICAKAGREKIDGKGMCRIIKYLANNKKINYCCN